jgi:hypothetical protein
MAAARELAGASLEVIREEVAQLSAPSPEEVKVVQAADRVLMAVGPRDVPEPDVRELLAMVGGILTATPEGKVVERESLAGAIAKSHLSWMITVQVLGTFLQNMRDIVCAGQTINDLTEELQLTPNQLNMLIGTSIAIKFGLSARVSRAVAALLVMVVDKAAYRTFCQLTDAQVIEKVMHSATFC